MGDKETRKRKKQRRESAKKEETDDSSPPREAPQEQSNKKKDSDHTSHSLNQPSLLAKLIFCILFILLVSAVGLIFYALNEATKYSDVTEGDIDHAHDSEALPMVDEDLHEFGDKEDDVHSDEEFGEHEGDISHSENSIEEILNSIEETITYDVDGQDTNNQEIKLDSLNNEDDVLEELDNPSSESERTPQSESIDVIDPSESSTMSPEDLYLYSSDDKPHEEPLKDNQADTNADLAAEELLDEFPSETISSEHPNLNTVPQNNEPGEVPSFQEPEDFNELDNEGENRVERSDVTVEVEPIISAEMEEVKIKPSEVTQNSEESRTDENLEHQKPLDTNEDVEEPHPEVYENDDITNDYDFLFKEDLDETDKLVEKSLENALKQFESLLEKNPKSPRLSYGKARVLDKLAETKKSNIMLDTSIEFYKKTMSQPNVPQKLYLMAGNRAVDRLRFRGKVGKALTLQSQMAEKFPDDIPTQNQLAVSFMWMGENNEAKKILREILKKDPNNGFAKVHLGFILKTSDQNFKEAIELLSEGIASEEEGVIDGRFFYHLGDALQRSGFPDKATKVYEDGVKKGVFSSAMQRSLYNVDGLTGKPWWKPDETPYFKDIQILEKNWVTIRNEALLLLSDTLKGFEPEGEGLKDTGDWQQFNLFLRGQKVVKNCQRAPRTCELIESIPKAATCKRGQVKFSIMQPGTHVFAHTGPTNCRLRAHLGLVVPKGPRIRVGNDTKEWTEGKVIIFDDSFEHEVWHEGDAQRLVLIIDFWHPELTENIIKTLTPI